MTGFLSRIFGGKGGAKKGADGGDIETLVVACMEGLIEKGQFDLSFDVKSGKDEKGHEQVALEFSGSDEELLKERDGQMIDSIQLFLQRVVQHNFPDDKTNIVIDCNGYREESNSALIELAEKLKGQALEKGKSVYFRALPPKDRKIVHQYLASDDRVKSRSIGDGLFKKIKIYPARSNNNQSDESRTD